jgi:hypothetical protein
MDIEKHLPPKNHPFTRSWFELKRNHVVGLLFKYARTQSTESAEKGNDNKKFREELVRSI